MRRATSRPVQVLTASIALVAGMLAFGLVDVGPAGARADAADDKLPSLRSPRQRGSEDSRLVTTELWGLHWHDNWKHPMLLNRIERRNSVPIFHLRILGDLAKKT